MQPPPKPPPPKKTNSKVNDKNTLMSDIPNTEGGKTQHPSNLNCHTVSEVIYQN